MLGLHAEGFNHEDNIHISASWESFYGSFAKGRAGTTLTIEKVQGRDRESLGSRTVVEKGVVGTRW